MLGLMIALVAVILAPLGASANTPAAPAAGNVAQGGPSPTPNTLEWISFDTARQALADHIERRIQWVRSYAFEYMPFPEGMTLCQTFPEGVERPEEVYAGWRYVIRLLDGPSYEVRVSYDLNTTVICDEVTSEIGSGGDDDDGGTVPGDIGTVADGPMEIGAQVPNSLSAEAIDYLNDAGMNWIKIQARPGQGWTGFIQNAHSNGLKVLVSVVGDHDQATDPAYHSGTYGEYLAALASDGADAIEVWNEPNLSREWPEGEISGASYVEMLKTVYPLIKAANSNTIVISAAPAPTGFYGETGCTTQGCNDNVWMEEVAQAGGAQYADCIGVHYNEGVVSPQVSSGDPRDNYPTRYFATNFNRHMNNFPTGMPACYTEIGYLSPEGYGPLPGTFAWAENTSVEEQAEWLAQAAVLASQQTAHPVRLFIVFNLNFTVYGADPQAGYGIVRPDGTCPACETLSAVQ
jgi:hypothetical protein